MAYENILAQIANPKPSNYLASYLGGVEARSALDEQQRQGQARQLAGQALTGDKAAGQQLAQVDPQIFMELRKFQGDERAKELERVGGLYYSADTPEKWAVAMNFLKKAGYEVSPEDEDFRNRDALLGMAMTAAQRITMDHQNREFAATQDYRNQSLAIQRMNAETGRMNANRGDSRIPMGYRVTAEGNLEPIPGGPADPNRPMPQRSLRPTTDQSNAAGFYERMVEADKVLRGDLAKDAQGNPIEGTEGEEGTAYFQNLARDYAPFGLDNYWRTEGFQKLDQAQRNFVNAVLRKESGAAISPSEFDSASKQYFPQPGDGPDVIRQKAQNRATAIAAMKRTGLPALQQGQAQQQGQAEGLPGMEQGNADMFLQQAQEAIQQGADPNAVIQRLQELGIDPSQLQ